MGHRVLATERKQPLAVGSADLAKEPVHKPRNMLGGHGLGLPDGLVHRGGIGDPIHEQDLVKGHPEDVEDVRPDPAEGKADKMTDHPVQPQLPPRHALNQMKGEGPIQLTQVGVFSKASIKIWVGRRIWALRPHENREGQISRRGRLHHTETRPGPFPPSSCPRRCRNRARTAGG
jgi:hypothetical protein